MEDLAASNITTSLSCDSHRNDNDDDDSQLSDADASRVRQHSLASNLHPKLVDLYKKRSHLSGQEERRRTILSEQKK